ncbi:MAG: hypothetical protein K5917_07710 [Clostridiales bacterium]|nr:hypothetical protein [Clostridiales bacterium]
MKKITAFVLSLILLFSTVSVAFAEEGNFGGGGGGMGEGTGTYYWNVGYDGVRISVFNCSTKAIENVEDFTNKSISSAIKNFGKVCKLSYKNGYTLQQQSNYTYQNLSGMPQIILTNGSNITAIKNYFTAAENLKVIAVDMGIDYNRIKRGQVKLIVEPMAYFCYDGSYYAMTATEAALFDLQVSGKLKYNMRPFSHNNLPLSIT